MKRYRLFSIGVGLFALALTLSLVYLDTRPQNGMSIHTGAGGGEPRGIQLSVYGNASSIAEGQGITITIIVTNPLATNSDLPNVQRWAGKDLTTGPCDWTYPLGFAVYNAQGTLMIVWDAFSTYFCPAFPSVVSPTIHFGPHANIVKSWFFNGFWTGGNTYGPGRFFDGVLHPFPLGEYTVVAGDIWGHLAVTHFTVVSRHW
ncbi:MAG TPA: hypothetical protein VGS11_00815 [Candidatus Bathyarchaeia archaeon]|nr:hypothetical protein [Candidatus Bathyarchaeia archaeon]